MIFRVQRIRLLTTKITLPAGGPNIPGSTELNQSLSSCAPGTKLTGLNILQGKSDPLALKDEEYPEWLWTLLDKEGETNELSLKALRKQSKQKIVFNSMNKN